VADRKKPPEVAAPAVPAPAPGASRADAAEAAARMAQAAVEAASAPAPAPTLGPEAVCADRNFLVRPMCLYQECQKPEFSRSALCLENARRLRESRPARD
jgi:hypothetical protein